MTDVKQPSEWVIVKHAQEDFWHVYWEEDPKLGVSRSHTAADTHTGYIANIQNSYTDLNKAKADCRKMNNHNPCGYYDVCPVID